MLPEMPIVFQANVQWLPMTRSCWVFLPQAMWNGFVGRGWGALLCSFIPPNALSFANSEQWEMGFEEGTGEYFHLTPSLYFDGGKTWRGRSGKIFPLHKEKERGNRVPVASCQAPGMRQPWELAHCQPPQRLLTWENWLSDCCQECRQWAFGQFSFWKFGFCFIITKGNIYWAPRYACQKIKCTIGNQRNLNQAEAPGPLYNICSPHLIRA